MAVRVSIDTGSKHDAELIAAALPGRPEALFRRGYGIVRLQLRHPREISHLLPVVSECVETHNVPWARIRYGDEELTFKARRARTS